MSDEDQPPPTTEDFSPEELALILAEIEGMRADMRAEPKSPRAAGGKVAGARFKLGLDDDELAALSAVCNAGGPAAILADHERRIQALERKLVR